MKSAAGLQGPALGGRAGLVFRGPALPARNGHSRMLMIEPSRAFDMRAWRPALQSSCSAQPMPPGRPGPRSTA